MYEQTIINDFFRLHVDVGFKSLRNAVKLNPQHTDAHRRTMFEVCNTLVKHNIPFWTEVNLLNKCIPDIVAPTHITPIIEVMSTETVEQFKENKLEKYTRAGFNSSHLKYIDAHKEFKELDLF